LISVSQPCDNGYKVVFEPNHYLIFDACGSIMLVGKRVNNIYLLNLHHESNITKDDDIWLWHKRFCHIHMYHLNWLNRKHLLHFDLLRKIKYVKHAKRESKPSFLLNLKTIFQLKGP